MPRISKPFELGACLLWAGHYKEKGSKKQWPRNDCLGMDHRRRTSLVWRTLIIGVSSKFKRFRLSRPPSAAVTINVTRTWYGPVKTIRSSPSATWFWGLCLHHRQRQNLSVPREQFSCRRLLPKQKEAMCSLSRSQDARSLTLSLWGSFCLR